MSAIGLGINSAWLDGRLSAAQAATALSDELGDLEGVASATAEYQPMALPDQHVQVTVIFAQSAPIASWTAADARIRAALASPGLATTSGSATFSIAGSASAGHVAVAPLAITPEQLGTELIRWRQLRAQLDPALSLDLVARTVDGDGDGYGRTYTVETPTAMARVAARWTAASSAADDSDAASTTWLGPGFSTQGTPSTGAMRAYALVSGHLPLMPETERAQMPALSVAVLDGVQGVHIEFLSTTESFAPTAELVSALAAVDGSGITPWMFDVVAASTNPGGFSGPCTGSVQTSDDDRAFLRQLSASGLSTVGFTPGRCIPARSQG